MQRDRRAISARQSLGGDGQLGHAISFRLTLFGLGNLQSIGRTFTVL
jgi:hypothetical protein